MIAEVVVVDSDVVRDKVIVPVVMELAMIVGRVEDTVPVERSVAAIVPRVGDAAFVTPAHIL